MFASSDEFSMKKLQKYTYFRGFWLLFTLRKPFHFL